MYPSLPHWVAAIYALLAVVLIPWIIYLGITLPVRHVSRHWDISWVGLDVAIVGMLLLNAVFSYKKSKWLVVSTSCTAALLCTDAWFDIMSAHGGAPFRQALASALLVELPLAILTLGIALRIVRKGYLGR
jgi:hypothetical protein